MVSSYLHGDMQVTDEPELTTKSTLKSSLTIFKSNIMLLTDQNNDITKAALS